MEGTLDFLTVGGNIIMSFAMRVRHLQGDSREMAPDTHHSCENLPALSFLCVSKLPGSSPL